jgi:UDP-3-O-[3-hydroxymyristoyl] glucosamine N-acyltransferase
MQQLVLMVLGFPDPQRGLVKLQIGNVIIGNSVEIGANSCIDRGKFSSTVLGMVAKLII